jgi:hypothetical protein
MGFAHADNISQANVSWINHNNGQL